MTVTEKRVLKEELNDLYNALEEAYDLALDYFSDAEPCAKDVMLAIAMHPQITNLLELVKDRIEDYESLDY